jgi:heme-degrading monooxygenase HmoA
MFARVVTVQIKAGMTDAAIKFYQDSVVPAAKQQPGCVGLYLLVDQLGAGKGVSVTLWESKAAMTPSEADGYLNQQLAKFGPLLGAVPTSEHFVAAAKM